MKWSHSDRFLWCRIVCESNIRQNGVLRFVFDVHIHAQHIGDCFVHALGQSILLRVVRSSFPLRSTTKYHDSLNKLGHERCSPVRYDNGWSAMSNDYIPEEEVGHLYSCPSR